MPRAELQESRRRSRERRKTQWAWFEARKRARPLAGLRFFQPTNVKGSIVLASRHWPDSITWSWSVWWRSQFGSAKARFPVFAYSTNSGGTITFGPLEIHWQEEMPHRSTSKSEGDRFIEGILPPQHTAD
jgi:hypothetical protein